MFRFPSTDQREREREKKKGQSREVNDVFFSAITTLDTRHTGQWTAENERKEKNTQEKIEMAARDEENERTHIK